MLRVCLALGLAPLVWLIGFAAQPPNAPPQDQRVAPSAESGSTLAAELLETEGRIVLEPGHSAYLIISHLDPVGETPARVRLSADDDSAPSEIAWHPVDAGGPARSREIPLRRVSRQTIGRTEADAPARDAATSRGRLFFLHVTAGPLTQPDGYVPVVADPVAEGDVVRVYLDRQTPDNSFSRDRAEHIVAVLEREIIPAANQSVGTFSDVDSDGYLSVLVTPWLDRLQGGRTSVNGFVRGSDFQPGLPRPLSNHADVIYLNSEMPPETHLPTLLGHEYLHLVAFSIRNVQSDPPRPLEEDWLSEAQAHLAENLLGGNGSNLAHRIEAFLADPAGTPLVVRDYYHRGLWRDDRCRGATYLFIRWLADVYGEEILPQLLQGNDVGIRNVEAATGADFDMLIRHWNLALLAAARQDTDFRPGYRYFQTDSGRAHFGSDLLKRLAIPVVDGDGLELTIAPTGSAIVRLDDTSPRSLLLRAASRSRLQLTRVPIRSPKRLARGAGNPEWTH